MTNAPSDLRLEQIPVSLRSTSQWVAWRYITRDGKQTKAPVSPHDGSLADSTSGKTWGTFDEAIAVARKILLLQASGLSLRLMIRTVESISTIASMPMVKSSHGHSIYWQS